MTQRKKHSPQAELVSGFNGYHHMNEEGISLLYTFYEIIIYINILVRTKLCPNKNNS